MNQQITGKYPNNINHFKWFGGFLCLFLICFLLTGCKKDAPEKEVIPSVKVFEVGKKATGQQRRISGKVDAAKQSILSFGVSGKVNEIIVTEGEEVAEGQVLANLDDEPFRIKLEDARAKLNSSHAKFLEAQTTLSRIEKLFKKRAASLKEMEAATANLAAANSNLKSAQGALSQAEIDYARTKLTAPFSGKIERTYVDSFQEVKTGESIFSIQSDDTLEVNIRVPETLIRYVDYNQVVKVTFPSLPKVTASGWVATVAAEAVEGNAFPVTINLVDNNADIRPGMTANVMFNFDAYLEGRTAYLIPLSAIAIDAGLLDENKYGQDETTEQSEVPVFILNTESGQINQKKIRVGGLRGNELEVFDGLEPGDLVVTAGVTFCRDGMKAKIWNPIK